MSKLDDILTELENAVERTTVARINGKTYSNRKIHAERKQQIKDLILELIDSCEEYESDLGSELVFDQQELRKKVEEL